jgi:hypothetical protein
MKLSEALFAYWCPVRARQPALYGLRGRRVQYAWSSGERRGVAARTPVRDYAVRVRCGRATMRKTAMTRPGPVLSGSPVQRSLPERN